MVLYTSRFQLAKSVELYHVCDSISNIYEIETLSYGRDKFELHRHYQTLRQLSESFAEKVIFDLVILSASSLQELSSLSSDLCSFISPNTKLFLETTGSIQLEPFVKMSMDQPHANLFSIVTDVDIRAVGPNKFKQFKTGNYGQNTVYLGKTNTDKDSGINNLGKYPSATITLLETFQRLFQKLFPKETISLCNEICINFISKQWITAIPKICFDSLMILLEEQNPSNLQQQIIAKPLISGLVTELITVAKNIGIKLAGLDNENALILYWQGLYKDTDQVPSLVYHFEHNTAPLGIDMLLLQTILLADDYSIKTPYLEFLYSVLTQYQRINSGNSKWFQRSDLSQDKLATNNELEEKLISINEQKDAIESQLALLKNELESKESLLRNFEINARDSTNKINTLNNKISSLENDIQIKDQENQDIINNIQAQLQATKLELETSKTLITQLQSNQPNFHNNSERYGNLTTDKPVNAHTGANEPSTEQYRPTGTPNLKDIEDMALFSVNYGDSPSKAATSLQNGNTQPALGSTITSTGKSDESFGSVSGDQTLKERELELRKKELELQERELEFQKKAIQQQQIQQQQQQQQQQNRVPRGPMIQGNPSGNLATNGGMPAQPPQIPLGPNRKPSFPQLQQAAGLNFTNNHPPPQNPGRSNRSVHGAMAHGTTSASNFVDPLAYGANAVANGPAESSSNRQFGTVPHGLKKTSRKNRGSNMPTIGNASSVGLEDFSRSSSNPQQAAAPTQTSHLNSLTSQNVSPRIRNSKSNTMMSSMYNGNLGAGPKPGFGPRASTAHLPNIGPAVGLQQRQFSSSTAIDNLANTSASSVVQHRMQSTGNDIDGPRNGSTPGIMNTSQSTPVISLSPNLQLTQQQQIQPFGNGLETSTETATDATPEPEESKGKKKRFNLFNKKKNKAKATA